MNEAILIQPKDKDELAFWKEILKRLQAKSIILTNEDLEDFNLGLLMKEKQTGVTCTKDSILKKLKK
ncbi:MAG: hypothetical protein PHU62_10405 [Bacteroidales bacterium]|jgi:hypothetical protein|nr:hypothetical protein [Bacteroidales bacterium]MDD2205695.1 hypothetical protein [Bacteroidales bacterium]MDD3153035.1 hypothetical protein [Bacteroidales bacterium]MDD3915353.1 hypothetical protein [Bacteroidales bacterium]MDD4634959.1 hypothetical protein [Bacteroidales bacterium]